MRITKLTNETKNNILENMLKRSPNNYGQYQEIVDGVLADVKENGDEAVFKYTKKFDGFDLTKETIVVSEEEIKEAYEIVKESGLLDILREALKNIREYHEKQRQYSWFDTKSDGSILGQKVTPIEKVGVFSSNLFLSNPLPICISYKSFR